MANLYITMIYMVFHHILSDFNLLIILASQQDLFDIKIKMVGYNALSCTRPMAKKIIYRTRRIIGVD